MNSINQLALKTLQFNKLCRISSMILLQSRNCNFSIVIFYLCNFVLFDQVVTLGTGNQVHIQRQKKKEKQQLRNII